MSVHPRWRSNNQFSSSIHHLLARWSPSIKKFEVINISNRSENILLIRFYLFILKYLSTVAGAAGVGSAMLSEGMLTGGGSTTTGEATVAFADRTAPLSILLVSVVT